MLVINACVVIIIVIVLFTFKFCQKKLAQYFDVYFLDVRIEKLEAGEGDEWEFLEWQARMRKLDHDKELEEFERRRLAGLLSREESIIARQKLIQHNKDHVAEMKAEVVLSLFSKFMCERNPTEIHSLLQLPQLTLLTFTYFVFVYF